MSDLPDAGPSDAEAAPETLPDTHLSKELLELLDRLEGRDCTLGELLELIGDRGFGLLLLVLALPAALPDAAIAPRSRRNRLAGSAVPLTHLPGATPRACDARKIAHPLGPSGAPKHPFGATGAQKGLENAPPGSQKPPKRPAALPKGSQSATKAPQGLPKGATLPLSACPQAALSL